MSKSFLIKHDKTFDVFYIYSSTNEYVGRVYYDCYYNDNDKFIKLNLLKINEEFKKLGYGKKLIQYVIEYFKNKKFERLFVLAEPYDNKSILKLNQEQLLNWYLKLGFKIAEEEYQININVKHILYFDLKNSTL